MKELQSSFKAAKHDTLLKEDLFAPSYNLINENISQSLNAFRQNKKDYAHWRLKEITSLCMDCHTRLPSSHPSSFQSGQFSIDETKFSTPYNLGISQLIVRRYPDAKTSFIRSIQDKIIKKEFKDIILPFKQILVIEGKVLKDIENLKSFLISYVDKKELPSDVKETLLAWVKRLKHWENNKSLANGITSEKDLDLFINKELRPLKEVSFYNNAYDIDLLITSGMLSNYIFQNPTSSLAPEISYC